MKRIVNLLFLMLIVFPLTINAETVDTTYSGEYSLDYLIRNYNLVTFDQIENINHDFLQIEGIDKKTVNFSVDGPVLINGNYYNELFKDESLTYSTVNPTDSISYISGTVKDYVQTPSKTSTNPNFIDFNKLYKQIVRESNSLVNKTEYHINDKEIQIDKPGIYQINNTRITPKKQKSETVEHTRLMVCINEKEVEINAATKVVFIDNYNPNEYYIFNNMETYEIHNYLFFIKNEGDETFQSIEEFTKNANYTGNIILNYPNARYINVYEQNSIIIAPKADVLVYAADYIVKFANHDMIIANNVFSGTKCDTTKAISPKLNYHPYTLNKKIEFAKGELEEFKEIEDFDDDIYKGEYTIFEMLKNYNLVTLGMKNEGSASIFHIAGQLLINGKIDTSRLDLESNRVNESAFDGAINERWTITLSSIYEYLIKIWGDNDSQDGTNSMYFTNLNKSQPRLNDGYGTESLKDFMNYERLYNSIVAEQKEIKKGKLISATDGTAKVKIGNNYYIDNISEIKDIVFEDFEKNSEMLTVITILDEGAITLPVISQTTKGNYVTTKDYYGKEEPLFAYEYENFPEDIYHGNIIWNIPNATHITLSANAPFIGHVVAPNADVEMPETQFAGGFIVNSLYAEGNSEAHFYPLQPVMIPENYDCTTVNSGFKMGKWQTQEMLEVIKEEEEAIKKEEEKLDNPKTGDKYVVSFVLILIVLVSAFVAMHVINKNKKSINF